MTLSFPSHLEPLFFSSALLLWLKLFAVSAHAETLKHDDYILPPEKTLSARALLEPEKEATISSEVAASIRSITVKNGQSFKKGETLVKFSCPLYEAGLEEALASLDSAQILHKSKQELKKLNSASDVEVELGAAEVRRLKAVVKSSRHLTDRCVIKAPFDGRVVKVFVNEFEYIDSGLELLSVLNDSQIKINLVVPSKWLVWLKADQSFSLRVDETGGEYRGRITQLGAQVDPVSQSIEVTGVLIEKPDNVLSGMSGTALFSLPET